jgi:hypothetical protein
MVAVTWKLELTCNDLVFRNNRTELAVPSASSRTPDRTGGGTKKKKKHYGRGEEDEEEAAARSSSPREGLE